MTTVATIGGDVPRQLILAADATPVRLDGIRSARIQEYLDEAADLLGAVNADAIGMLAQVLTGLEDTAAIVVSNDSEASLRTFYVLRILAQRGRIAQPVHLLDLQRLKRTSVDQFNRWQLSRLVGFLESVCGARIDGESCRRAAESERPLGDALIALRAARRDRPSRISGSLAASLYAGARASRPEVAAEGIARAVAAAPPAGPERARVVLTGSAIADPQWILELEALDMTVVAEDHAFGDAEWIGVAEQGDLSQIIDGLAGRFSERPSNAALGSIASRAEQVRQLSNAVDADAVISVLQRGDEAPLWDISAQRNSVERTGRRFFGPVRVGAFENSCHELAAWLRGHQ